MFDFYVMGSNPINGLAACFVTAFNFNLWVNVSILVTIVAFIYFYLYYWYRPVYFYCLFVSVGSINKADKRHAFALQSRSEKKRKRKRLLLLRQRSILLDKYKYFKKQRLGDIISVIDWGKVMKEANSTVNTNFPDLENVHVHFKPKIY